MLNSPLNPTGSVYGREDLAKLAEVLGRYPHIWVLADDIYEKLVYPPAVFSTMAEVAPDLYGRTLTVNGVSKANSMTGWRVGYGAGPLELIKAMNTIQGQTSSHTSSILQYAAVEAIAGDQSYIAGLIAEFRRRRDLVVSRLNDASGLRCRTPEGAFYVYLNCAGVIGKRTPSGQTIASDTDFAMHLLDAAGVAVVPGSGFMASPYIRISYASSYNDLERACRRIIRACAELK